jgi:pyruvate formate lyase activating enzyme
MGCCALCGRASPYISKEISVCLECIRCRPEEALEITENVHCRSRVAFGLPQRPPKGPDGIACLLCANECIIPEGQTGYCGIRTNKGGKLIGASVDAGILSCYHDPLPTNCVADWVCPGGTGEGYPVFANCSGPELGFKNLAVFFHSCSFNCLFCQNWQFKKEELPSSYRSPEDLASSVDERTSCICYFGGDPSTQLPFSLKASHCARRENPGSILRICWETNGSMHPDLLDEMIDMSMYSGGCIKFDLKAWNENIHRALCGVNNTRTLDNFKKLALKSRERFIPALAVASTLLVPGYIDEEEIRDIARFIAALNPDIPYSLIAFYPHFYLCDMPLTPKALAYRCRQIAQDEGLTNVTIGNLHLLV